MFASLLLILTLTGAARANAVRPLIVIGVDGLASRYAASSPGFNQIMRMSAYTLRARTVEHTRSSEAWRAIFAGGYDITQPLGPRHPPMFTYIRQVAPEMSLYFIGGYSWAREAAGWRDADFYDYGYPAIVSTTVYINAIDRLRNGTVPDLSLLYLREVDFSGHESRWGSVFYREAVERTAVQILRIHARFPTARIIITSDHGGAGGGHNYNGRNMRTPDTDIDCARHRDIPYYDFPVSNPRPLCDTIRNSEIAWIVSDHFGFAPHPSWQQRAGWLNDTNCTHDDVSARPTFGVDSAAVNTLPATAVALVAIGVFALVLF